MGLSPAPLQQSVARARCFWSWCNCYGWLCCLGDLGNGIHSDPRKGVLLRFRGPYRYFQYPLPLARLLLVSALGLLLPLPGTVVLIAGEAILVLRLRFRDQESTESQRLLQYRSTEPPLSAAVHSPLDGGARDGAWGRGFRTAASKWGLAASLILFTVTLQDRIAEIGAALSFLIWLAMNAHHSIRSHS